MVTIISDHSKFFIFFYSAGNALSIAQTIMAPEKCAKFAANFNEKTMICAKSTNQSASVCSV